LAFRAQVGIEVTEDDAKQFSLSREVIGKTPNFWWIMFSDQKGVFDSGNEPLYHVVLATFDGGNPPQLLDSLLKSIMFEEAK